MYYIVCFQLSHSYKILIQVCKFLEVLNYYYYYYLPLGAVFRLQGVTR
jgi:hypothetical protein